MLQLWTPPPAEAGTSPTRVGKLGDTVALCPPLIISEREIDELLCKFPRALDETASELGRC